MKNSSSLSNISIIISEQLKLLDIASGEEYLTAASNILVPVQQKLHNSRNKLCSLVEHAIVAKSTDELRIINDRTVSAACELFASLRSVPVIQEFCTTVRDAIAERALELARLELNFSGTYCDSPLALLSVGSDGRKEQTLFTDQDYLFLYCSDECGFSQSIETTATYFGMLGSIFAAKLEEAGISRCSGGIMPINEDWRGSFPQWQERLTTMLRFERKDWEKNILNLIALMDTRFVCGDRDLGLGFGKIVRSMVSDNPEAIRHMAMVVSSMRLSRGFLRRFIVEAEGVHKGEFNFKILAWMPLVMAVRLMAVNVGIEETSTLERIKLLRADGHLTDKMAAELTSAYHILTGHRITQQMKRIKRIIDDDCYMNPYELPGSEREELKNAIASIDELQNMVRSTFSMTKSLDHILLPRL